MNLIELLHHYADIVRITGDRGKAREAIENMVGKNYILIEAMNACVNDTGNLIGSDGGVYEIIVPEIEDLDDGEFEEIEQ